MVRHGRLCWVYFLPILHLWAPAARAQSRETDLAFHAVPFREWLAEGPKTQLPWRARIFAPELSQHQRIWARVQIEVDGNELLKRCCDGRSVALVEITDQQGRTYRNYAAQDLKEVKPGLSQYMVTLSWNVFVLPGDYQVALALYYSGREGHSLAVAAHSVVQDRCAHPRNSSLHPHSSGQRLAFSRSLPSRRALQLLLVCLACSTTHSRKDKAELF